MSSGPQWPEQPETHWELASVRTAQLPRICKVQIAGAAGPGGGLQWAWASGWAGCPHVTQMPIPWKMEPNAWGWRPNFFPHPGCSQVLSFQPPAPQAFTSGLRRYLQYYRACVLSTPPTLSLLTIGFLFKKLGRQLR